MREVFVYVLFRPWDGSPCYVGKGKGRRWESHEWCADNHCNRRLGRIIKKARRLGMEVPRVKVRENLIETESFEIERALIAAIGRSDQGRGPLVNLTDGGEGASNPSLEVRAKMSVSGTAARLGTKRSQETRDAIGRAHKGRIIKPEWRAKMSTTRKDKPTGPISQIRREAIRAALLAFWDQRRQNGLPLKHARRI